MSFHTGVVFSFKSCNSLALHLTIPCSHKKKLTSHLEYKRYLESLFCNVLEYYKKTRLGAIFKVTFRVTMQTTYMATFWATYIHVERGPGWLNDMNAYGLSNARS